MSDGGKERRKGRGKKETDQYNQSFNLRLYNFLKVLVDSAMQAPLCKTAGPMMQSADNKEKTAVQKSDSTNLNLPPSYRLRHFLVKDLNKFMPGY